MTKTKTLHSKSYPTPEIALATISRSISTAETVVITDIQPKKSQGNVYYQYTVEYK